MINSNLNFSVAKIVTALSLIVLGCMFWAGSSLAHAQTTYATSDGGGTYTASNGQTYTIPSGYSTPNYGVFYDSDNGMYYDPLTGGYSTVGPDGPATLDSTGAYNIPSGYAAGGPYGTYYNPTNGVYYDAATGFYSNTAPTGPVYSSSVPGLPNTGAGGDAGPTIFVLALLAILVVGGAIYLATTAPENA